MELTESELNEVLRLHKLWLEGDREGTRANLFCAELSGVDLGDVDLSDADLRYADLSTVNLSGANLNNADLRCADLSDADLSEADLRNANLSGASLDYADLHKADLRRADLSDVDLRCATLCKADLSHACLNGANLNMVELGHNACYACVKGAPIYQVVCGFGPRNAALTLLAQGERTNWRWFTGCFEGSEEELRAAVAAKHGNSKEGKGYLRAIDYLIEQAEDNTNTGNAK